MNSVTGADKKLYGLDHLRALAIILVFLYHYGRLFPHPEWTNTISSFGWAGVDLFFVLSGYLIASQLFKSIARQQKISLKEFFVKRTFRILPAYFFVLAIYFLIPAAREREALAPLWKYLTFTQNIGLDVSAKGTFSHAWSLCIEEQFYLLLPLILIAMVNLRLFKKGYWLLLGLFASGFLIRWFLFHHFVASTKDEDWITWSKWIYYPTWSRLDGLLIGVSIAALLQFKPAFSKRLLSHGNRLLMGSLILFAIGYFFCGVETSFAASVFGFPLVDAGFGCMVLCALSPNSFLYMHQSKTTSKIAALSYGIYLIHKIVIHVMQPLFVKVKIEDNGNIMFLICVATVFLAAIVLNKTIEKPFLALRGKILEKEKFVVKKPAEVLRA
ncbi:MAG TPA: acyltransferase [Chitinophagaceae bacterium]